MERLRHLVVIVPGILGSVLEDRVGRRVWGPRLPQVGRSLLRPSRLSLAENRRLVPAGLLPTISVVPPMLRVPGYDGLIRLLRNSFTDVVIDTAHPGRDPVPNADVLAVPYDFRLGIEAAAEYVRDQVEKRLSPLQTSARQRWLIVVAHSMGGLVARHWLELGGGTRHGTTWQRPRTSPRPSRIRPGPAGPDTARAAARGVHDPHRPPRAAHTVRTDITNPPTTRD